MRKPPKRLVNDTKLLLMKAFKFPLVAYTKSVRKCTTLLRAVGLGIITLTRGPEEPTRLFTVSRKVALARCGVHILPSAVSIILITINLLGYFIGDELQGFQDGDSIKLGILQVCAKVQELLVVSSLSAVIFHVLRSELVFGPGLPLGLMGAGFKFTSLSFFWSSEFWGSVRYKQAPRRRKIFIFGLLAISGVLAVLAGPTSAVLMIPRELDWKIGGYNFHLNGQWVLDITASDHSQTPGTKEEMWPQRPEPPPLDCSGSIWMNNSRCLASGYQSIHETFMNRRGNSQIGVLALQIADGDLRKNVHARVREPFAPAVETWAFTAHVPSAVMQAASFTLWISAPNYLISVANLVTHPNPKLLGYGSDRTAMVETELPAARVVCNDDIVLIEANVTVVEGKFPMLPEYSLRLKVNPSDGQFTTWFETVDITGIIGSMINTPSQAPILVKPIDIPQIPDQASSAGIILLSADDANRTRWMMQACSVDARWAKGSTKITENYMSVKYDFGADQPRSVINSEVDFNGFGWGWFVPPNDGTWRRINVSAEWLDALNPEISDEGPLETGSRRQTTIESILQASAHGSLGDQDSTLLRELALAVTVIDGLSRSSSYLTANYSSMFEPLLSEPWNKSSSKSLVRLGGPTNTLGAEQETNNAKLKMRMQIHGYAMSVVGWFDYLCIAVLLTHTVIALAHSIWIIWHRRTSDAWENITEMMALGLNSERPDLTGEDGLSNTSAGIRTWVPTQQVGWIEAFDSRDAASVVPGNPPDYCEQLQLRFGQTRHITGTQKDSQFQANDTVEYGRLDK
ncbi:hypothetical protein DER45DRAFT_648343 [Fusarium avenaceum]|nr:hypothetical protein DER45DRAFT_648343 [Fusarium avenaceum]